MEEVKEQKTKMEFKLPNKKVKVSPIRRKGGFLHPSHAASFLFGGASVRYGTPIIAKDRPIKVLTNEEEAFLSKALDRDLSVYKKKEDNYWLKHQVQLKDEVRILDLSDPQDYLDYKLLLSLKDDIAPDGASKFKKGTYRFCISEMGFEDNSRALTLENKIKGYKFAEKLFNHGIEGMSDFLTAYYFAKPGKRVPENATAAWLKSEIDKVLEEDLTGFLAISEDPDFDIKLLINKAVNKRALYKDVNRYSLPDGGLIATNLDDLLIWFKDPKNSDEVLRIEARVQ